MSDFTAFHSLVMCGYVCVCDGQKFTGLWNVSWVCVCSGAPEQSSNKPSCLLHKPPRNVCFRRKIISTV